MVAEDCTYLPFIEFNSPHTGFSASDHISDSCVPCLKKRLAGEILLGGSTSRSRALLGYAHIQKLVAATGLQQRAPEAGVLPYEQTALEELAIAIELDQDNAFARGLLGNLAFRRGEHSLAAQLWSQVAVLKPDSTETLFNLALAQAKHGEWVLANFWFREVLKKSTDFPHAREMKELSEVQLKKGFEEVDEGFVWPAMLIFHPSWFGPGSRKRLKLAGNFPVCQTRGWK